jgi:putative phosphoesterase
MKIGVLSDTHGDIRVVQRAIQILQSLRVDLTIHCGDVGAEIVPLFEGLPTHFVYGNIDDRERLREVITDPKHTLHDKLGTLEIEEKRVAFLHGDDVKLLHHTIHSGHWDLVCHGHTHAFSSLREGETLVLNPGAVGRTAHPSLAVVELPSLTVTEIPL